jgi:hypothetical protein
VTFLTEVGSFTKFNICDYQVSSTNFAPGIIRYIDISGNETLAYYMHGGPWDTISFRYCQFGAEQTVTPLFKQFIEANATRLGDYAFEAGDYCFKLDMYYSVTNWGGISIPLLFTDGARPSLAYN